jgi:c(7)-type cytochrome triheme protein
MKKLLGLVLIVLVCAPAVAWSKIGGGNVTFRPSGADRVLFKHEDHTVKAKVRCSECHQQLYSTTGKKRRVMMTEMEKGQSCGACHDGKRAFSTGKENCKKCHQ